jgi:hypothetical protein
VKYELLMECRAGTRHAFKTVLIIVLPDGTFKLHKVCSQCKSDKFPIWGARGQILKSPTYKHSKEYREFLDNHNPAEARMAILGSDIKKVQAPKKGVTSEANDTRVRSVRRTGKKTGRRKLRLVKRPRDKARRRA